MFIRQNSKLAEEWWENGVVEDCPIYDMHGHMGVQPAIYFAAPFADDMVALMRRANVKKLCFSHHYSLWATAYAGQQPALEACQRHPDILRFWCSINPHFPEQMKADLEKLESWAPLCVGLKFLPDYHKVTVLDDAYKPALEFAEEHRLAMLTHTWGGSPYSSLNQWKEIAPKYPHIKILMGHCFNNQFADAARFAAAYDNVYLELTSVPGVRGPLETMVSICGSKKIFFGTDMPWFDEHQAVGGLLSSQISDDDIHNILHRNAEKLLEKYI